jgi:hypothetical protein
MEELAYAFVICVKNLGSNLGVYRNFLILSVSGSYPNMLALVEGDHLKM